MENIDSLKRQDEVTVTIYGPEDNVLYKKSDSGFHNIEEAINSALNNANIEVNPEDCVFEVSNDTSGVSHRYRINAHGHLKLIV